MEALETASLNSLEELKLDFKKNSNLSENAFAFLCRTRLPKLKSLYLRFGSCEQVSGLLGIAEFLQSVPQGELEHMVLSFKETSVPKESCIRVLGAIAECQITSSMVELPGFPSMACTRDILKAQQRVQAK